MKKITKLFISMLAVAVLALPMLCTACGGDNDPGEKEPVDYVSSLTLDMSTNTKKQEVTVRNYIDGDTTHFDPVKNSTLTGYNAADFASTQGYIKARYLAVNTPESTGKIEPWGKKASKFTRSKLENAQSIIVESDDDKWNIDSTGERYTLWIWYLPKGEGETAYRNLNVEILQNGLALASSVASNRYGTIASQALMQANDLKLYVHSDERDPDFPYGAATPVTLKELRFNAADYESQKVKVEGVVTSEYNNSVYIEDYDEELGIYIGVSVYYGFQTGSILDILALGNRVSVVGVFTYYEVGDTYQISGVTYNEFEPTLASNTTVVSEGHEPAFAETSASDIMKGSVSVTVEKDVKNEAGEIETVIETKTLAYGEAIMSTTVTVKELTIKDIYTTKDGNSKGAMSITCEADDGTEIVIRTEVLKDKDGNVITADKYPVNSKITVKGLIDKYDGKYQVKVYRADFILPC